MCIGIYEYLHCDGKTYLGFSISMHEERYSHPRPDTHANSEYANCLNLDEGPLSSSE